MGLRNVLTIGGTIVGAFFGAPQLGFMIGSLVGNAVDPIKNYGPRLSDAKIQTARDGTPIAWGAGRFRTAGTVIAVQPGGPTEHEEEEGGKGGGPVNVTYTYTYTFAVLICEGPILGIRRIWADQKLVYDVSEQPTHDFSGDGLVGLLAMWAGGLAASTAFANNMSIYLGDETQMPDAELEALFGVGNVPAHRGMAYAVFKDYDVTQRGGSLPNLEFEVVKAGSIVEYSAEPPTDFMDDNTSWHEFAGNTLDVLGRANTFGNTYGGGYSYIDGPNGQLAQHYQESREGTTPTRSFYFDWTLNTIVSIAPGTTSKVAHIGSGDNTTFGWNPYAIAEVSTDAFGSSRVRLILWDTTVVGNYAASGYVTVSDDFGLALVWHAATTTLDLYVNGSLRESLATHVFGYHQSGGVRGSGISAFTQIAYATGQWSTWARRALTPVEIAYLYNSGGYRNFLQAQNSTGTIGGGNVPGAPGWEVDENGNYVPVSVTVDLVSPDAVSLAGFLEEISTRSNIPDDGLDTSDIANDIEGFVIQRETNGGAVVTVLSQGFFFDAAEWDGKIRFVPRGGGTLLTLDGDDVLASDGAPVRETIDQEIERPRKINVAYFDPELFYIPTKQTAERRSGTVAAVGETTIELPIVFSKDDAAQVADKHIKIAWTDQLGTVEFGLPSSFSYLVPTDVVNLTYRERTQRVRIERVDEDGGRLFLTARQDRLSAYDSTATGIGDPRTPQYPQPLNATAFVVMNLPALRTADNVPGVYMVACGTVGSWPGCAVEISYDGGASYQPLVVIRTAGVVGELAAVASDPAVSPVSEIITVDVYGNISSVTPDQIAAGANMFAIVDDDDVAEIGQVQTVVAATGTGDFDLMDPLRGQLGTTAVPHVVGERFAMLGNAVFVPIDVAFGGTLLYFRPVTLGTAAEENVSYSLVFDPGDIVFDGGEIT